MKISSLSAIVLGYYFICEFVFNGFLFTPFLIFFLPRLKKRFVLLFFALQIGELSLHYFLRRDFYIAIVNSTVAILGRSRNFSNYDWMMFVEFILYTLLSYGLSLYLIRKWKLHKRVGL